LRYLKKIGFDLAFPPHSFVSLGFSKVSVFNLNSPPIEEKKVTYISPVFCFFVCFFSFLLARVADACLLPPPPGAQHFPPLLEGLPHFPLPLLSSPGDAPSPFFRSCRPPSSFLPRGTQLKGFPDFSPIFFPSPHFFWRGIPLS